MMTAKAYDSHHEGRDGDYACRRRQLAR